MEISKGLICNDQRGPRIGLISSWKRNNIILAAFIIYLLNCQYILYLYSGCPRKVYPSKITNYSVAAAHKKIKIGTHIDIYLFKI